MRCSENRLLQLATKPRLQSMRSDTSSQVWPSASNKISRARRASSARPVRLVARRVNSLSSECVRVIASLMDTIIVYNWLLQSTRSVREEETTRLLLTPGISGPFNSVPLEADKSSRNFSPRTDLWVGWQPPKFCVGLPVGSPLCWEHVHSIVEDDPGAPLSVLGACIFWRRTGEPLASSSGCDLRPTARDSGRWVSCLRARSRQVQHRMAR